MSTIVYDQDFSKDLIPTPNVIAERLERAAKTIREKQSTDIRFYLAGSVEVEIELNENDNPGINIVA